MYPNYTFIAHESVWLICIFLSMQEHSCRSEGVDLARELDYKAAAAWVGHPYFDVIDNSTDFETKMNRMLECVCQKLGIDTGDRLLRTSRKLKFLGKWAIRWNSRSRIAAVSDDKIFHSQLKWIPYTATLLYDSSVAQSHTNRMVTRRLFGIS